MTDLAKQLIDQVVEADIKTKDIQFFGILGREKGKGKFKPFDYENGKFVGNIMLQTTWPDKKYVQELVDAMNGDNPKFEFKVVKR